MSEIVSVIPTLLIRSPFADFIRNSEEYSCYTVGKNDVDEIILYGAEVDGDPMQVYIMSKGKQVEILFRIDRIIYE